MELRDAQIILFDKFAHMYDSGVPIAESLEIAGTELGDPVAPAVQGIIEDLYRGTSLADALALHDQIFSGEIVGIMRAGERRGELGHAARSVAAGLKGRVVAPRSVSPDEVAALLAHAERGVLHLDPDGVLRVRTGGGIEEAGRLEDRAVAAEVCDRAGVYGASGAGAFAWNERVARVVRAETPQGPATVITLSARDEPEPAEAAAWRAARPGLLLVQADDPARLDGALLAVARALAGAARCIAVDLPAAALSVARFPEATALDPDAIVAAAGAPVAPAAAARAVGAGVRVAVGTRGASELAELPHFRAVLR